MAQTTQQSTPILVTRGRAVEVCTGIAGTGTDYSQDFVLPNDSGNNWGQVMIQGIRTNTTDFSALKATLEVSLDGGLHFGAFMSGIDLVATPVQEFNTVQGVPIYRFNITTATIANAATAKILITLG